MRKKLIALLLTFVLVISLAACGTASTNTDTPNDTNVEESDSASTNDDTQKDESQVTKESTGNNSEKESEAAVEPGTLEALEVAVTKDVEDAIAALTTEMDTLVAEIDAFDQYIENADKMEAFYKKVCNDSALLGICLMEHAVTYAEFIMNSDADFDDKYDNLDELYDVVYEDSEDEFYDGIYDGILEEMYDIFYDELLDNAYDSAPYEKWLDARSNEYEWLLDARSDTYEIWLDTRSDIYEFWLDLRGAAFEKDAKEMASIINDFKEDIAELKTDLAE